MHNSRIESGVHKWGQREEIVSSRKQHGSLNSCHMLHQNHNLGNVVTCIQLVKLRQLWEVQTNKHAKIPFVMNFKKCIGPNWLALCGQNILSIFFWVSQKKVIQVWSEVFGWTIHLRTPRINRILECYQESNVGGSSKHVDHLHCQAVIIPNNTFNTSRLLLPSLRVWGQAFPVSMNGRHHWNCHAVAAALPSTIHWRVI